MIEREVGSATYLEVRCRGGANYMDSEKGRDGAIWVNARELAKWGMIVPICGVKGRKGAIWRVWGDGGSYMGSMRGNEGAILGVQGRERGRCQYKE